MSIANLVLQYVRTLVWPAVVAVAIVVFRHEARALLRRLKSLGAPGFNAEFEMEAKNTLETAKTAVEVQESGMVSVPDENPGTRVESDSWGSTRVLAEYIPFFAVHQAWQVVELKMRAVLIPEAAEHAQRPMTFGLMISLLPEKGVKPWEIELIQKLRRLYDQAMRNKMEVTTDAAQDFISTAALISDLLDAAIAER